MRMPDGAILPAEEAFLYSPGLFEVQNKKLAGARITYYMTGNTERAGRYRSEN